MTVWAGGTLVSGLGLCKGPEARKSLMHVMNKQKTS